MALVNEATVDYEACRVRLFDAPFNLDNREQMLVIGDRLETDGDPRGLRIALSEALAAETDRAKRAHLTVQLERLPNDNADELLGPFAPYRTFRRTLNLEWLGGAVYKARIDTRHLGKRAKVTDAELLGIVLKAPVLRTARHLWVRTRGKTDGLELLEVFRNNAGNFRDVEVVLVGPGPWPQTILERGDVARDRQAQQLADSLPRLILVSIQAGAIPLSLPEAFNEWSVPKIAAELGLLQAPLGEHERSFIGRGLCSAEPELRAAAAEAAVRCQALVRFAESFELLLRPRVCSNPQDLATAIGKSYEPCPPLERILERIASDSRRFDQPTRSAAGLALAARKRNRVS